MAIVEIPEPLVMKAIERGIDIEKFVIDLLLSRLKLDPKEEAQIHIDLAKNFLRKEKNYCILTLSKHQKNYTRQLKKQ